MTESAKDLSGAPYKIVEKDGKFQVVNNLGVVKATFADKAKARDYQKALYANVPGAAKVADKKPWTGTAKKRTAAAEDDGNMVDGDDVKPASLASAVDASLDAATQLIMSNQGDVEKLPGWAQQVLSLTISAGETVDELLEAMGVPDPDDAMPGADAIKAAFDMDAPRTLINTVKALAYIERARTFTKDQRDKLASSGAALPDGSFPIQNKGDLHNALLAFGRAGDKGAAKSHIRKRAAALGATDMLPDSWKS